MKTLILKIVLWMVKTYLVNYHLSKNPVRKPKEAKSDLPNV